MKKNIIIIVLLIIIILLGIKLLNPTVVTERKLLNFGNKTNDANKIVSENNVSAENAKVTTLEEETKISDEDVTLNGQDTKLKDENISLYDTYNTKIEKKVRPEVSVRPQVIGGVNNELSSLNNYPQNNYNDPYPKVQRRKPVKGTVQPDIPEPIQKKSPKSKLEECVRTCKPYSEKLDAEYLGMNMKYKISIHGWVNNKCLLKFDADMSGVGSSFSSIYGVDSQDVQIVGFAPKITCRFTKEQLDYVGDSILQENERNNGATNNMLKNPNSISQDFSNISDTDVKLMDVIFGDRACQIENTDDLTKMMNTLLEQL